MLVYSGDVDGIVPITGTRAWITKLGLPVKEAWRPYTVNGQVGGYTIEYDGLRFASVRNAGHMVCYGNSPASHVSSVLTLNPRLTGSLHPARPRSPHVHSVLERRALVSFLSLQGTRRKDMSFCVSIMISIREIQHARNGVAYNSWSSHISSTPPNHGHVRHNKLHAMAETQDHQQGDTKL